MIFIDMFFMLFIGISLGYLCGKVIKTQWILWMISGALIFVFGIVVNFFGLWYLSKGLYPFSFSSFFICGFKLQNEKNKDGRKWRNNIIFILIVFLIVSFIALITYPREDYKDVLGLSESEFGFNYFQDVKENNLLIEEEEFWRERRDGFDIYYFKEGRFARIEVADEVYRFNGVGISSGYNEVKRAYRTYKTVNSSLNILKFKEKSNYISFLFDKHQKVMKVMITNE